MYLHGVAHEENRHVVAHHVKVTFAGIKLDGKSARVRQRLGAALLVNDGGEPRNERRLQAPDVCVTVMIWTLNVQRTSIRRVRTAR